MDDNKHDIKVEFIPAEHWRKRAKWRLLESYTSHNENVEVPVDFETDGASIPFFARKIFSPTGRYFGAAIIHDYILCSEQDWDKANYEFHEEMCALDIKKWRKSCIMASVRIRAWLHKIGIYKSDFNVKN